MNKNNEKQARHQALPAGRIRLRVVAWLLACGCLAAAAPGTAQQAAPSPDQVKAAFLYHFGAFVEWPSGAAPQEAITIAVLGAPRVAEELRQIVPGRTVQNRPVQVREIDSIDELADAQILFIGDSQGKRVQKLLDAIRGRPVLSVTQADDGLEKGAMINFALVDRRVRFEVSLSAAEQAGLELSSRLLAIALHVQKSTGRRDLEIGSYAALPSSLRAFYKRGNPFGSG
ncbi:hypothetical protein BH24PSE2_BH24PSE2_21730 [soil metagenome]